MIKPVIIKKDEYDPWGDYETQDGNYIGICREGLRDVLGRIPTTIKIYTKNPKRKGAKRISFKFNRIFYRSSCYSLYFGTCDFMNNTFGETNENLYIVSK